MKTSTSNSKALLNLPLILIAILAIGVFAQDTVSAQKGRSGSRKGSVSRTQGSMGRNSYKPTQRPTTQRPNYNRPTQKPTYNRPTQHRPTQPAYKPNRPTTRSSFPTKPNRPTYNKPTQHRPTQPTYKPNRPTTRPSFPTKPNRPTTRPNFPKPIGTTKPNFPRPTKPSLPRPTKPGANKPNFPKPTRPGANKPNFPKPTKPLKPHFPKPGQTKPHFPKPGTTIGHYPRPHKPLKPGLVKPGHNGGWKWQQKPLCFKGSFVDCYRHCNYVRHNSYLHWNYTSWCNYYPTTCHWWYNWCGSDYYFDPTCCLAYDWYYCPVKVIHQNVVQQYSWHLGVNCVFIPGRGLGIQEVQAGSPAELAGLEAGMVIVQADGVDMTEEDLFVSVLQQSTGLLGLGIIVDDSKEVYAAEVEMTQVASASY